MSNRRARPVSRLSSGGRYAAWPTCDPFVYREVSRYAAARFGSAPAPMSMSKAAHAAHRYATSPLTRVRLSPGVATASMQLSSKRLVVRWDVILARSRIV